MKARKTHARDGRLYVNAGMSFPRCYAGARLLDMSKGRLATTADTAHVTCAHCRRILARGAA